MESIEVKKIIVQYTLTENSKYKIWYIHILKKCYCLTNKLA